MNESDEKKEARRKHQLNSPQKQRERKRGAGSTTRVGVDKMREHTRGNGFFLPARRLSMHVATQLYAHARRSAQTTTDPFNPEKTADIRTTVRRQPS